MCDMNAVEIQVRAVAQADSAGGGGMIDSLLRFIADPAVRDWYILGCFALMILPILALTFWYHSNIGKTEGGRRLMERQNKSHVNPRGSLNQATRSVREAGGMAGDIESGAYGTDARSMQHKVYWTAGLWALVNIIAFGLIIWADEVTRVAG